MADGNEETFQSGSKRGLTSQTFKVKGMSLMYGEKSLGVPMTGAMMTTRSLLLSLKPILWLMKRHLPSCQLLSQLLKNPERRHSSSRPASRLPSLSWSRRGSLSSSLCLSLLSSHLLKSVQRILRRELNQVLFDFCFHIINYFACVVFMFACVCTCFFVIEGEISCII